MKRSHALLVLVAIIFASALLGHQTTTLYHAKNEQPEEQRQAIHRERSESIDAKKTNIGKLIPSIAIQGIYNESRELTEARNKTGALIAIRDSGCPISNRYGPRLAELQTNLENDFLVIYLYIGEHETTDSVIADLRKYELKGLATRDPDGLLSRALQAKSTTEVFLLDQSLTLQYRGAIDDQYGIGFTKILPTQHYLNSAIASLRAGTIPEIRATRAAGCHIAPVSPARLSETEHTFHNHISRILQEHCQDCHRTSGVAPFPLETYTQAKSRAAMIKFMLKKRLMPPWFADPAIGHWKNDRSMPKADRSALLGWIDTGKLEGDPQNAPVPRKWPEGWIAGEPDAVLGIEEPVDVPATGYLDYQYRTITTSFNEDRWIQKIEFRSGAPAVAHHIVAGLETSSLLDKLLGRSRFSSANGGLAVMTPGQTTIVFEPGTAKRLRKGAKIRLELHYTPNGTATQDSPRIGLTFAEKKPTHEIRTDAAVNTQFEIPPNENNHKVYAQYEFEDDSYITTLYPHMHLRGKSFEFEAIYPNGTIEKLLRVPQYDFNWQLRYELESPKFMPAGTRIKASAWFDNSKANSANPDPSKAVKWGEQTYDEMMVGLFDWYKAKSL